MIMSEFWPLGLRGMKTEFASILRQAAGIARDMNLPAWAVCPGRWLAAEYVLRDEGFRPSCRWRRVRILGKTYTKQLGFRQRHVAAP
jgi:hypothetical protein